METVVKIETLAVNIPNVGPMFRRAWKMTNGEELRVEYMHVVFGEVMMVPEPVLQSETH